MTEKEFKDKLKICEEKLKNKIKNEKEKNK